MSTIQNYDPKVLGRRLKLARTNARITQNSAAKELGVARTTIVAIEKGERKLKDDEFVHLCSYYNISASTILRPSQKQEDIIFKFRRDSKIQVTSQEAQEATELLLNLASASEELESMLGRTRQIHQLPKFIIKDRDIKIQAEDAASTIRQIIGIGNSPISDLFSLLEFHLGFSIFVREMDSKISGIFINNENTRNYILLNAKHPLGRLYFTAAHELGHAISSASTYHVNLMKQNDTIKEEIFANSFSNSFLMPASFVRKIFDEYRSLKSFSPRQLIIMAKTNNVSSEAMCRRLEDLGLLKQGTYDSIRERGFSPSELEQQIANVPTLGIHLVPERIRLMMADAYSDGLLSEGQLSKKFSLDRIETRELLYSMQVKPPVR